MLAFFEFCAIIYGVSAAAIYGGLAQLVRAPASHAGGRWFESISLHQKIPNARAFGIFVYPRFAEVLLTQPAKPRGGPYSLQKRATDLKTSDFYYDLPQELIAQTPLERRDGSRLLVMHKQDGSLEHRHFFDLPE